MALGERRDRELPMPKLILHSLQMNIRGGRLPGPEDNGKRHLKIPLDALKAVPWELKENRSRRRALPRLSILTFMLSSVRDPHRSLRREPRDEPSPPSCSRCAKFPPRIPDNGP